MGRERAIIRWDVHRQMLLEELERLKQAPPASAGQEASEAARERLTALQARLQAMGPSPQAKMG